MSNEIKALIGDLGETIKEHKNSIDDSLTDLNERLESVENAKVRIGLIKSFDGLYPTTTEVKVAGKFLKAGNASDLQSKMLSTTIYSERGFNVVPALHSEILKRLNAGNPLRGKVCFIPDVDSNSFEQLVSVGGSQALRKAELSERGKTTGPELKNVEIKIK